MLVIDIPLYPLARTFMRKASNIRVLSGESGLPTPETVHIKEIYISQFEENKTMTFNSSTVMDMIDKGMSLQTIQDIGLRKK